MNHWKSILCICFAILQAGQIMGQIFGPARTSSIDKYSNTTGSSSIIKSSGNYTVVYNKDYGNQYSHTFFVYKSGSFVLTPLSVHFTSDFGASELGFPMQCTVNDIELHGDTCYFCGQMSIDWDAPFMDTNSMPLEPNYQDYGFVGKFALMPDDSNYTVLVFRVENTSNLTRLAVSHDENNTNYVVITAIGDADGLSSPTCLVEVRYDNTGGIGWKYSLGYPSPTGHIYADIEHFEDVLALSDGIVVVSRRECYDTYYDWPVYLDDKHFEFLIYKSSSMEGYSGGTDVITLFNTKNDMNYTWHSGSERMRLCNYKNNGFCLSYSTRYQLDVHFHLTYAFSDITTLDSAITFTCASNHHIQDISFNFSTGNVYLLGTDSDNPNGIVYMLPKRWDYWGNNVYSLKKPNYSIDFIDNRQNTTTLDFVGYNTTHTLFRFGQIGSTITNNYTSCFTKENIYSNTPYYQSFTYTEYDDKMDWYLEGFSFIWLNYTTRCSANQPLVEECSTHYFDN